MKETARRYRAAQEDTKYKEVSRRVKSGSSIPEIQIAEEVGLIMPPSPRHYCSRLELSRVEPGLDS